MPNNTGERLARLEEKVDNIDTKLDKLIDGLDNRYASKWVEKWVWIVIVGITGLVLKIFNN